LCAAKNLNSKKPWKKKNQRVFFGRVVSERNVGGGTVVNVQEKDSDENESGMLHGFVCSGWRRNHQRGTQ
jgi:hypothetical protein